MAEEKGAMRAAATGGARRREAEGSPEFLESEAPVRNPRRGLDGEAQGMEANTMELSWA